MPTVCDLKAELGRLGVRGYSGKRKAELEAMLEEARPRKAPAPRKGIATAVPNPAAREYKTISKPAIERQAPSYKAPDVPAYKSATKTTKKAAAKKSKKKVEDFDEFLIREAREQDVEGDEEEDLSDWLEEGLDDILHMYKLQNKLSEKAVYKAVNDWFNEEGVSGRKYSNPAVGHWLRTNKPGKKMSALDEMLWKLRNV